MFPDGRQRSGPDRGRPDAAVHLQLGVRVRRPGRRVADGEIPRADDVHLKDPARRPDSLLLHRANRGLSDPLRDASSARGFFRRGARRLTVAVRCPRRRRRVRDAGDGRSLYCRVPIPLELNVQRTAPHGRVLRAALRVQSENHVGALRRAQRHGVDLHVLNRGVDPTVRVHRSRAPLESDDAVREVPAVMH
eukprot:31562-Pelagococcus_subviridis.AAC.16